MIENNGTYNRCSKSTLITTVVKSELIIGGRNLNSNEFGFLRISNILLEWFQDMDVIPNCTTTC